MGTTESWTQGSVCAETPHAKVSQTAGRKPKLIRGQGWIRGVALGASATPVGKNNT